MKFSTLSVAAAMAASVSAALDPVEVKGNAFFVGDKRFYIKGIDYQPGGSSKVVDPLADPKICTRDIKWFKDLGVNAVRIYTVDNSADHSECMKALDDAGIYLILDVNTPLISVNRAKPYESYNAAYLQHVFATIDTFKDYSNTLGFFAANEVINAKNNTNTAPVIKAVVRDMKEYIKNQADRKIPVGYSAADVSENRYEMAQYFNCGPEEERIDMLGMNDYSWCGNSTYEESDYEAKVKAYGNYSIPIFLSEFGCNEIRHNAKDSPERPFTEIETLYSDKMTPVFSGGLVYEYSQEANDYGIVKISGDSVSKYNGEFDIIKAAFAKVNPQGDGGYKKDGKSSTCPARSKTWEGDGPIPDIVPRAKDYMKNGAGKAEGLSQQSTQEGDSYESGLDTIGNKDPTESDPDSNKSDSSSSDSSSSGSSSSGSSGSASASGSSASSTASGSSGSQNSAAANAPAAGVLAAAAIMAALL